MLTSLWRQLQLALLLTQLSQLLAPRTYQLPPGRRCEDSGPECAARAGAGECEDDAGDALTACRLSCRYSSLCAGGDCCHQAPLVLFCSDCAEETADAASDDMGGPSPHGLVFVVDEEQPRDRTWLPWVPLGGALRHLRFDHWDSYDQTTVVVDAPAGAPVHGAVPME